ncbi:hypothetical protein [Calothrix sp. PCC 6303]|uniref:hypothetical protein n=1 Tax=Calothrix sp. PCC 6303 TaxID=1170562 RepID=UPI0002A02695|nr:hypothetical protein [Calothrix sp. PCC 6303]AFZ04065.1 hypothetical protein Cal6303_5177 [Calothrix sp. PCC 6303]
MKYLVFCGLFIFILLVTLPVDAAVCHNLQGQRVCIANIQRSAKKHWEYRVIVSVDGDIQPLELYNCRSRYRVSKDKVIVSFEQNDIGTLICNTLNHRNRK